MTRTFGFASRLPSRRASQGTSRRGAKSASRPTALQSVMRVAAAAVFVSLGISAPAFAHAELVSATPAVGSTITDSPGVVVLNFSEDIDTTGTNLISVMGPLGDELVIGPTRVAGPVVQADVKTFTDEGTYVVSYRVISADGHEVKSAYAFEWFVSLDGSSSAPDVSASPTLMSKPMYQAADPSATRGVVTGSAVPERPTASTAMRWIILGVFVAALLAASKALRTYRRKRLHGGSE